MPKDIHKLLREKNRTLNQWEQYYGKTELRSFPIRIQFPTGARCNIKCRFCTERHGKRANDYNYKDLSFADFHREVENRGWKRALGSAIVIDLYGWGEPLVNPDYERIFDYIAENLPGLGISISTNGTLFDQKWSEKILAIDNSEVNFSVNAATQRTFLRLTGSSRFENVIANIHILTDLRVKRRTMNPSVSLSYVATTENIRELPQFVNLAADLKADSVLVQDAMIFNEETERLSLMNKPDLAYEMFKIVVQQARQREIKIEFASFETHQENYFPSNLKLSEDPNSCYKTYAVESKEALSCEGRQVPSPYFASTDCFDPWERLMISADGEVFPCCSFQNLPETSLGNIHHQSFQEIWNGYAYSSLRRTINTNDPPLVCAICPRKKAPIT